MLALYKPHGRTDADDDDNAQVPMLKSQRTTVGHLPLLETSGRWRRRTTQKWVTMEPASDIDTDGDDTEVVEARSAIKCNARLADALPGIVDFKGTEFGAARELLFRK